MEFEVIEIALPPDESGGYAEVTPLVLFTGSLRLRLTSVYQHLRMGLWSNFPIFQFLHFLILFDNSCVSSFKLSDAQAIFSSAAP